MERMNKILIVEDNRLSAKILKDFLEENGYEIFLAETPEQAYHAISNLEINLVIMDIVLGTKFDGIDIAENIQKVKNLPIIFFSGSEKMIQSPRLKNINYYGYFIKGTPLAVLLHNIEIALKLHFRTNIYDSISDIIEYLPFFVIILDKQEKNIWKVNKSFLKFSGYTASEVIGKNISNFIKNIDVDVCDCENCNKIIDFVLYDGLVKKLNLFISNIQSKDQDLILLIGTTASDFITPENDAFLLISGFKQIFEKSHLGVFTYDKNGIITNCNQIFSEIIGAPISKLIGLDMNILPNKKLVAELKKALNGEIGYYEDFYTSYLTGKTIPVKVLFLPVIKDTNIIGGVSIVEDITEKYNHEQNLIQILKKLQNEKERNQALLDANPDMMFTFDENGVIIDYHSNQKSDLYVPPEVFLGKNVYKIMPKDIADLTMEKINLVKQNGKIQIYTYKLSFNDGERIYESRLVKCGEKDYLAIVRDVTEREKHINLITQQLENTKKLNNESQLLNKELKAAKEKAEESEKIKTKFIQNISHEIRTPMNAIIGFSNLLKNDDLTKDKKEHYINIIEKSSLRLLEIIDDMLKLATIVNQNVSVNLVKFQIFDLVSELKIKYSPVATNKNIGFVVDGLDDLSNVIIETDYEKLYDIINKLLANAIKYTERGSVTLKLVKQNNMLLIEVIDTGKGFENDDIFTPFAKDSKIINNFDEGLGISLAIVKAYVEICKGRISVNSKVGEGTTFRVEIPVNFNEIIQHDIKNQILNILIVDDDILNYQYMYEMLSNNDNLKIFYTKNGFEAIELVKKQKFDVIFMDLRMPEMNGNDAAKEIRKIDKTVKIYALTALADDLNDKELRKLFDDMLTKPVNWNKITKILKN